GLVGALNLRGSLAKARVPHSMVWAEDFADASVRDKLRQWLRSAHIEHDLSHLRPLEPSALPDDERRLGEALAAELRQRPAILGVFDEGCMGMFNAIIPDHLLHAAGAFKERLSQSGLYAAMQRVPEGEAREALDWLQREGMTFEFGSDPEADLTEAQVLEQLQMYIAAARLAAGA